MIVENVIKDEMYQKLIEYAFTKCDAVMLVSNKQRFVDDEILKLEDTINKLKSKFSDSLLKSRNGAYWGYTKVGNYQYELFWKHAKGNYQLDFNDQYDPEFENLFEVLFFKFDNYLEFGKDYIYGVTHFFRLDSELKQFLLEKNSIYDWVYWNNSMENLCFYIDDFCFLTSVAHENMLGINCRNKEEYKCLKSIGIRFRERKFIKTNDVFIS